MSLQIDKKNGFQLSFKSRQGNNQKLWNELIPAQHSRMLVRHRQKPFSALSQFWPEVSRANIDMERMIVVDGGRWFRITGGRALVGSLEHTQLCTSTLSWRVYIESVLEQGASAARSSSWPICVKISAASGALVQLHSSHAALDPPQQS